MWLLQEWDSMAGATLKGFGKRLAALRKGRGLTQQEVADAAGTSQRMIAHYETTPSAQPPAALVAALAQALGVTTDELLGLKPPKADLASPSLRLRKRLLKAEQLPASDQRTLLRLLDALLSARKAS